MSMVQRNFMHKNTAARKRMRTLGSNGHAAEHDKGQKSTPPHRQSQQLHQI